MDNIRNILSYLYDFYIVAKCKNMTVAANKIYTSPSNLSKRMQILEELLNLKLINSNNKGVSLTSDGEELLKMIENNSLGYLIKNENVSEAKGRIVIGSTRNIADNVLADYLYKYNKMYPDVEIKIVTDSASNLNSFLVDHKIDILIDYFPQINFTEKDDFEIRYLSMFNTCFACNKDFYLKHKDDIKELNDLNNFNLVIPGSSRRRQMLDEILQRNNVILKPKIEMPDSILMIEFVKKSNFIGYFIVDELVNSELEILDLKEDMPTNPFGVIYSRNALNLNARRFVDLLFGEIQ